MLGWTGRGLQAGEAHLACWRPLQAARPTGQPMTPDTQPGRWAGAAMTGDPNPQEASAPHRSTHGWQWATTGTVCMSRMSALE